MYQYFFHLFLPFCSPALQCLWASCPARRAHREEGGSAMLARTGGLSGTGTLFRWLPWGSSTSCRTFKEPEREFQDGPQEWFSKMIWMITGWGLLRMVTDSPNLQLLKTWHCNLNGTFWQKSLRTLHYYVLTSTTAPFKTYSKEAFSPFLRQAEGLQIILWCWQLNAELPLQVLCTLVAYGKVFRLKM